jgi:hypothetical protein
MLKFKPRAEPENRRRSERHATRGMAKISSGSPVVPRDCWITDSSDGGARLHTERLDIPDSFLLALPGAKERRECRVAWRLGHEMGVQFAEPLPEGLARQVAGRR